jgi:hypothetical protein
MRSTSGAIGSEDRKRSRYVPMFEGSVRMLPLPNVSQIGVGD